MTWLPKKKILVPFDFSETSLSAIDTALQLVADPAHVTVVHVLQELSPLEPGEIEMWNTVDTAARIRHGTTALRERLKDPRYADVKVDVLIGDAGHEIADLADRENADLIVLPSHGRRGLTRLLIGSVAERVVRLAHCPVLVLKAPVSRK
jgi:nucleotide-binding universal stress UspA family protein